MRVHYSLRSVAALLSTVVLCVVAAAQTPLGTVFTYQGQLKDSGIAVNGTADFRFWLYDAATSGTQIGTTQTMTGVSVNQGLFAVSIDFGAAAFDGDARWL